MSKSRTSMHLSTSRLLVCSMVVTVAFAFRQSLSGPSGTIQSVYSRTYPDNLNNTWIINVKEGRRIFLNFSAFDLEDSFDEEPCVYDYLQIEEDNELVRRYCGNRDKHPLDAPHAESYIESCSNSLTLQFVSDFSNVEPLPKGFSAFYMEIGDTCMYLPPPDNGKSEATGTVPYEVGTMLDFTCDDGFQIEGESRIYCMRGGEWTAPAPRCVGAYCRDIRIPDHGDAVTIIGSGPPYTTGTVVQFTCKDGFRIVGKDEIRCLGTRVWSHEPPYCHETVCEKNENYIEEGRRCRRPCETECDSVNKLCLCDGYCGKSCFNPKASCTHLLRDPLNGRALLNGTVYGDIMTYECDEGYTLNGHRRRRCRSDKKWTGSTPQCVSYDTCGQAGDIGEDAFHGRVVYGKDALPGAWPWQALLLEMQPKQFAEIYYQDSVQGGGSVINRKWILSAAHVFRSEHQRLEKEQILVLLGMTKLPKEGSYFPDHVHIHEINELFFLPTYNIRNLDWDAVLIRIGYRLRRDADTFKRDLSSGNYIDFDKNVRPVCLPCLNNAERYDQKECTEWIERLYHHTQNGKNHGTVTGFGKDELLTIPENLQQGAVEVRPDNICRSYVRDTKKKNMVKYGFIAYTEQMMCAESSNQSLRTDACTGDSGGALVRQFSRNGLVSYYQIGIVSWGVKCGYMGFYTSLTSVMQWVSKTIQTAD